MQRGEVWWANLPKPTGRRPVLILSRNIAIHVREYVTVAEITTTIRHIPVEVHLRREEGMPKECVINLDVINTIPKKFLVELITELNHGKLGDVEKKLKFALALE